MSSEKVIRKVLVPVMMIFTILALAASQGLVAPAQAQTSAPSQTSCRGGIFVTGHDPDYHAAHFYNVLGAQHIIQCAVKYVSFNKPNPTILLVTDLRNPGGDNVDSRLGIAAAGYSFDVADYGSGAPGTLDLRTINFNNYDVVIVASDYGGWLRQEELDILNARSAELIDYINRGGGLVVFNESGNRNDPPGSYNGTTHGRYGFLPFLTASVPETHHEHGVTVTPAGLAIGLTNADVNGNWFHSYFTNTGGMSILDVSDDGEIVTLATRGKYITAQGVVREVAVDIKPQSCPNPINVKKQGVVPVAILGTAGFDVIRIDPTSVRLEGVAPLRFELEDVSTPFLSCRNNSTDCNTDGPDGVVDLTLKFDAQAISAALGTYNDREVRILKITGKLKPQFGGDAIAGEDIVIILNK